MIEKYTKDEIVAAIKYKSRFDVQLVPALIAIIKKEKSNKAYSAWERATDKFMQTLKLYSEYNEQLIKKYGKFKLSDLTKNELQKLLDLAIKNEDAEELQKICWENLEKINNDIINKQE